MLWSEWASLAGGAGGDFMPLAGVGPVVTPNRTRFTRRRLLRVAGGSAAALGIGPLVATGQDEADEKSDPPAADGEYVEVYGETIDSVVLVTVPGVDEETPGGLGSGFVVDGTVVTNNHVVGEATEVELQFEDERWRTGTVIGTDVHSDLAAVEVDDLPEGVDGLELAADPPEIGQEVLALGNPLGFDASISQGIVSGVDRSLASPTGFSIPAAIQTDAPVDPGNSGGPLVNLDGDVLGIVFAGAGRTLGFAISAQLAERVVPALVEDGEYSHPYMGVGVEPVGPLIAEANDLEEPRGVLIVSVTADSPAADALEPANDVTIVDGAPVPVGGDVVVEIDGEEIPNQDRLASYLALEATPGQTVDVEVIRDGERRTVELTLEERPAVDAP